MVEHGNWRELAKYFIHGIAFSFLMIVLLAVWAFLLVAFTVFGSFLGLIIGVLLLFFIVGGLNSVLTSNIWSVEIKTGWMSLLAHGFILTVLLLMASIPSVVVELAVPGVGTTIVFFFINAFLDGFVAKNVAFWWKDESRDAHRLRSVYPTVTCPSCKRKVDGSHYKCPWCGTNLLPTRMQAEKQEPPTENELPKETVKCPQCGNEVLIGFARCPYCGLKLSSL